MAIHFELWTSPFFLDLMDVSVDVHGHVPTYTSLYDQVWVAKRYSYVNTKPGEVSKLKRRCFSLPSRRRRNPTHFVGKVGLTLLLVQLQFSAT